MRSALSVSVVSLLLAIAPPAPGQPPDARGAPPPMPLARKIPGLTAPDPYPNGRVDCHVVYREMGLDARLSVQMAKSAVKIEPKVLESAKATSADPSKLAGKHPKVTSFENVPASCFPCHKKDAKVAPPFGRLLHAIHFGGGEKSPFLTMFQGECVHSHKLDPKTGIQKLVSGAEMPAG